MASWSTRLCKELLALQGVLEYCGNVRFVLVGEKPPGGPRGLLKSVFGEAYLEASWCLEKARQPLVGRRLAPQPCQPFSAQLRETPVPA